MSNLFKEATERFVDKIYGTSQVSDETLIRLVDLDKLKVFQNQAVYTINYKEKNVAYSKGIKELLGYDKSEYGFSLIVGDLLHPDQKPLVNSLTNVALEQAVNSRITDKAMISIILKLKHKNGTYLNFLRQTGVYERMSNGILLSTYSVLTNLNGLVDQSNVTWVLEGIQADLNQVQSAVQKNFGKLLTPREWEILKELKLGQTSEEIGDRLNCSRHTVDTHRRKMLKKIGVCDTVELLNIFF